MRCKKILNNKKAISPIFATLILIAIAVIAGIVVYVYTSGTIASMTSGGTAVQEKVAVQAASSSGNTVTVIYQSTAGPLPVIEGMLLKDSSGNTVATLTMSGTSTPTAAGVLTTVTGTSSAIVHGSTYTVTLISRTGGSFVSPSFSAG